MTAEKDRLGPSSHIFIAPASQLPDARDIRRLTARLGSATLWTDAAVEQLASLADAAERWLAEYPAGSVLLVDDPAAAVVEMERSGFLTAPVQDLLMTLRALGRSRGTAARPASQVSFGPKPALRFAPRHPAEKRRR